MAMYVDDFKFIGCFNEQIEFWGAEDIELEFKSLRAGLLRTGFHRTTGCIMFGTKCRTVLVT